MRYVFFRTLIESHTEDNGGVADLVTTITKMETFRQCWKAHGNDERTSSKDADKEEKS